MEYGEEEFEEWALHDIEENKPKSDNKMQQKDYKIIAGIINKRLALGEPKVLVIALKELSKELADYFEREEQKRMRELYRNKILEPEDYGFNRKQFILDCGVNK